MAVTLNEIVLDQYPPEKFSAHHGACLYVARAVMLYWILTGGHINGTRHRNENSEYML